MGWWNGEFDEKELKPQIENLCISVSPQNLNSDLYTLFLDNKYIRAQLYS